MYADFTLCKTKIINLSSLNLENNLSIIALIYQKLFICYQVVISYRLHPTRIFLVFFFLNRWVMENKLKKIIVTPFCFRLSISHVCFVCLFFFVMPSVRLTNKTLSRLILQKQSPGFSVTSQDKRSVKRQKLMALTFQLVTW